MSKKARLSPKAALKRMNDLHVAMALVRDAALAACEVVRFSKLISLRLQYKAMKIRQQYFEVRPKSASASPE